MEVHKIARYGWNPDALDHRDLMFAAPPQTALNLPPKIDLRNLDNPIYDQQDLGSCTGNAIAGALQFVRKKENLQPNFNPSRLWIYWQERKIENTINSDAGAQIRDGIKVVASLGVPPEALWPYDITKFKNAPPTKIYPEALKHKAVTYYRIQQDLRQLRSCLADGYPFVFGFSVFSSFESAEVATSGHVPLPGNSDNPIGGHAVMAVGYSDTDKYFICRNSWGMGWGIQGYFTLPYDYVTRWYLAQDFWTIRVTQ